MPALIVEASFLSNPKEDVRLANPEYRWWEANAIARGVGLYAITHDRDTTKAIVTEKSKKTGSSKNK